MLIAIQSIQTQNKTSSDSVANIPIYLPYYIIIYLYIFVCKAWYTKYVIKLFMFF